MQTKKRRRRSSSAAIYIPAAVFLIVLLGIAGTSVFLRIISIEVTGATVYSADDIIKTSGITDGDNLLFLNSEGISSKLSTVMPYIKNAAIEVSMPDSVLIKVEETSAAAVISVADGAILIDADGKALEHTEAAPEGLIEIRGLSVAEAKEGSTLKAAAADETKLNFMCEMLAAFEEMQISGDVGYLDVSNLAYTSFNYKEQFTAIIGKPADVVYQLTRLQEVAAELPVMQPESRSWTLTLESTGQWRSIQNR